MTRGKLSLLYQACRSHPPSQESPHQKQGSKGSSRDMKESDVREDKRAETGTPRAVVAYRVMGNPVQHKSS